MTSEEKKIWAGKLNDLVDEMCYRNITCKECPLRVKECYELEALADKLTREEE